MIADSQNLRLRDVNLFHNHNIILKLKQFTQELEYYSRKWHIAFKKTKTAEDGSSAWTRGRNKTCWTPTGWK